MLGLNGAVFWTELVGLAMLSAFMLLLAVRMHGLSGLVLFLMALDMLCNLGLSD